MNKTMDQEFLKELSYLIAELRYVAFFKQHRHDYAAVKCDKCRREYCYSCCDTNADIVREPCNEYWTCPHCGHTEYPYAYEEDYYEYE